MVESGILLVLSYSFDIWLNFIIDGVFNCCWLSGRYGILLF